jgi:hypothetical protein
VKLQLYLAEKRSWSARKGVSEIQKAAEPQAKRMNLNVPVELHSGFKAATAYQDLNMTDVLLEFIQQRVAKNAQSTKQPKGRRQGNAPSYI